MPIDAAVIISIGNCLGLAGLAVDDGVVAGFVSTFLTVGLQGRRRWEVDLLAVDDGGANVTVTTTRANTVQLGKD